MLAFSAAESWYILGSWLVVSIIVGVLVGRAIDLMGGDDD